MDNSCLEKYNNDEIVKKLDTQINLGDECISYLKTNRSIDEMNKFFTKWRKETEIVLGEIFKDNQKIKMFSFNTDRNVNKFSKLETINILTEGINWGIDFLEGLKVEIKNNKCIHIDNSNYLERSSALIVIRKILQNFYKHIKVMYQEETHGNGTIKKEDLDKIKIGNEYDVQRILYSLIRPVFPSARIEVSDDTGYKAIRYDIIIDEYSIVIEVKCTRKSMTERNLTEELGSDAFHYKADYLFFFIYDKENIIRNVDAFIKNYKREKSDFGTDIEAIVNQSINI